VRPFPEGPTSFLIVPYLGFQDPSFSGSLIVNLKDTGFPCEHDLEYQEFKPADLYSLNKVMAILTIKYGSAVIPGVNIIFESGVTSGVTSGTTPSATSKVTSIR
jgi:hypothetical protein